MPLEPLLGDLSHGLPHFGTPQFKTPFTPAPASDLQAGFCPVAVRTVQHSWHRGCLTSFLVFPAWDSLQFYPADQSLAVFVWELLTETGTCRCPSGLVVDQVHTLDFDLHAHNLFGCCPAHAGCCTQLWVR